MCFTLSAARPIKLIRSAHRGDSSSCCNVLTFMSEKDYSKSQSLCFSPLTMEYISYEVLVLQVFQVNLN